MPASICIGPVALRQAQAGAKNKWAIPCPPSDSGNGLWRRRNAEASGQRVPHRFEEFAERRNSTWRWPTRCTACIEYQRSDQRTASRRRSSLPATARSTPSSRDPTRNFAIATRPCSTSTGGESQGIRATVLSFHRRSSEPDRGARRLPWSDLKERLWLPKRSRQRASRHRHAHGEQGRVPMTRGGRLRWPLMEVRVGRDAAAHGQAVVGSGRLCSSACMSIIWRETYFQRALAAGAPETAVRVGLANTYLALGRRLGQTRN